MNAAMAQPDETAGFVPGLTSIEGKPVRGLFVIATDLDGSGTRSVAVWQLDMGGNPTGAWMMPETCVFTNPLKARTILLLCERRALVAYQPDPALDVLRSAMATAGVAGDVDVIWGKHVCLLDRAVQEIAQARLTYSQAVETEKARTGRSLAALEWPEELPVAAPATLEEFLDQVGVLAPSGVSPAASAALSLSRAVRWCMEVWADTETARTRRLYLRDRFGPVQPVPPSWREAVTGAYQQVLPLS